MNLNTKYSIRFALLVFLISFQSAFSQTKNENRLSQERTRSWQYESICSESGGAESTYLIQVTSYVADLKLALQQAKKNAIHAVLFKGVAGNNLGCTTKDPLISDSKFENNFVYFEDFFFNTYQYNKYATAPTGVAELSETYKVKGKKNYKVTYIISVNVDELRKKLEFDNIIKPLGFADEIQGIKPSIMIFPSDVWLQQNGYYTIIENQGRSVFVPDYDAALRNDKLNIAVRTLDGMISERGYPTIRLAEEIKSINQGSAVDNTIEGRYGGASETSILEEILNTAKADIIWKVTFTKEGNGIQNWIEYGIEAIDAYTNKSVAVEDGSGPKAMNASEGDLIRQAVSDKMDAFLTEHQTYFNGIVENGREISLEIRRFDSFEYYFNDDVEFKGREMEFSSLIRGYAGSIAKDKNFSFNSTENRMDLKNLRIEMSEEVEGLFGDGTTIEPLDAAKFAKKISRFIKQNFGYTSKVTPFGLGKARITIGEK